MRDQPHVNPRRDGPQPLFSSSCHSTPQKDDLQTWNAGRGSIPDRQTLISEPDYPLIIGETSSRRLTNENGPTDVAKPAPGTQFVFGEIAVYLCALVNFSLGVSLPITLSVMFLDWQEEFQVSRAHTAAVQSTAAGILFGGALLPGYVMNRWGSRFTVLVGSGLSTLGCFMSCFATSIDFLIMTAGVLGGLGFCFIHLPAIPAVIKAIQPKYRSIAITWCSCGIAICNMGLPFLYRYLTAQYSWRGTFFVISGICMQTVVFGLVMTSYMERSYAVNNSPAIQIGDAGSDLPTMKEKPIAEDSNESENSKKEITNGEESLGLFDEVANGALPDLNNFDGKIDFTQDTALNLTESTACPRVRNGMNHIRNSKWKFLVDYMFILLTLNVCTCITYFVSLALVMMDFARTKGFSDDAAGPFFLLIIFISNLTGRLTVGPLSCIPHLHTIQLMGIFGVISSIGMIVLGNATDYTRIIAFLAIHGYGAGGVLAVYPKCTLDLDSVDEIVYPLAFGVVCSMEGICDFVAPILLGYAVDRTGSYTAILHLLGSLSLVCSSALFVTKTYAKFKSHRND